MSGEVNMIPTLRKISPSKFGGGASLETLSGEAQLKKHPVKETKELKKEREEDLLRTGISLSSLTSMKTLGLVGVLPGHKKMQQVLFSDHDQADDSTKWTKWIKGQMALPVKRLY